MKKGRFLNDFEEPPDHSALSNATENTPYAELGIMLSGVSVMVRPQAWESSWAIAEPLRIHCH